MSEYLAEHWALSIIVTIALGDIGSGLWDAALKPISRKFGSTLFTVITFGAKRARDKIYKGAAMGHHELPSLYILLIVLTIGVAMLVVTQIALYVAVYAPEMSAPSIISKSLTAKCLGVDESKWRECVNEQAKEKIMPLVQVVSLISIFVSVVIFYRFATINRMNLITTYYEQCLKAVTPFLDDRSVKLIEHTYAMMKTKEEYEAIVGQMAEVAKTNGASLPDSYV
ncbi:MAG: hypothetical protein HY525_09795 [Betaproteobacteria bacterium]|nr:hypothetical protein [Betaproteobacteria bacterium]